MSTIGLAASPRTAVLPTWWMPPVARSPIAASSAARSRSNAAAQAGSWETISIGSSEGAFKPEIGFDVAVVVGDLAVSGRAVEGDRCRQIRGCVQSGGAAAALAGDG